jgi:hypothetical protein
VTGSPQPTDVERAAIKEGYRAVIRAKSPTSHLVELVVFGLSEAGMLQSPESAAEMERLSALLREVQAIARRRRLEAQGREAYGKRLKTENTALLAERAERNIVLNDVQVEAKALRERVAELEAAPAENALFEQSVKAGRLRVQVEQVRATAASALELLASGQYGALRAALEGMASGASRAEAIPAARDVRPVEDPHDSPLDHAYLVGRDLPARGEAS